MNLQLSPAPQAVDTDKLAALARRLRGEGRVEDALTLWEHIAALRPEDPEALRALATAFGARGRTLEALETLATLQALHGGPGPIASEIREQSTAAIAKYNALAGTGQVAEAEKYAAALARLLPTATGMLAAALQCNQVLGRTEEAERYARALIALEPDNVQAQAVLAAPTPEAPAAPVAEEGVAAEVRARMAAALDPQNAGHPLLRLRDIHDVASLILCHPLTAESQDQLRTLVAAGLALDVPAEPGSEWEGWAKHYRVLLESIDLDAILAPTPEADAPGDVAYMTSAGKALTAKGLSAHARKLGAEVVFFAAADEHYVELYARWYALSVLKYCDVPCLIVVHVIGGREALAAAAEKVGIRDDRLVFAGCGFEAGDVACRAFDAPPKGEAARPIAHFQSVRFQRLGALLKQLKRPVFVSDIDLLLQRGVADLLARCEGADVVFNENGVSFNAGSRLTANLLLAYPTADADVLLRCLKAYLDDKLAGAEVTRWIDQVALIHARHHLQAHGEAPNIAYFDTASDINNVMYPSYQEHPFRFLSLFHGFDTSSLEDPRVLGGAAANA
ncbi:hypothetical protein [Phenylobacterium sp.]|uniref:hypothetical protein n=1 Tax=Phenylobacterium sp. TaxID=1871053 RepID=UPI002FE14B44